MLRTAKYVDHLTEAEAAEMLQLLSVEFQISCPILDWSDRARRGFARTMSNRISLGPLCWRGTTNSLLHEFAHILTQARWRKDFFNHPVRPRPHGKEFILALHDTACAWFDNAALYDWSSEYKSIADYGRRQGF